MEKIYEEQSFNPKRKQLNFSVVLSFVVALFAIGSLVVVGFNQISFAAEDDEETFTLNVEDVALIAEDSTGHTVQVALFNSNIDGTVTDVFCIEQGKDAQDNGTYKSDKSYSNIGLSYILSMYRDGKILPEGSFSTFTAQNKKYIERYVTQVAIWLYLDQLDEDDPLHWSIKTAEDRNTLKGSIILKWKNIEANASEDIVADGETVLYNDYIKPVIDRAKEQTIARTVKAEFASNNIDKISNGEIFQTAEVSVVATPANHLLRYYVQLVGMNDAYVVDKDGNRISDLTPLNPTDKFWIRVPVNKVTKENNSVDVVISGDFDDISLGEFYACGDAQQVVKITPAYPRISNSRTVNFLVTPDTGMTTAQTIYFIGLIVLLCGVGIIYANAKPIEE